MPRLVLGMRPLTPLLIAAVLVSACQCGPDNATPVTFRVENPLQVPIFVDQSDGRMGLKVKRRFGSDWIAFVESPSCECVSCDVVCERVCTCEPQQSQSLVMKVLAGGSAERTWAGQVQVEATASCSGTLVQGPACLRAENPSLDEEFHLELCYALSSPGAEDADAGVSVPGNLSPNSVLCVEKPFRVQDGVVQIAPGRGADCGQHSDCTGAEELCFNGACTTACPAPEFPRLGGAWQVRIPEPADQGFFTFTQQGDLLSWTGTGTVGSVRYDNNTMTLRMSRPGPNNATYVGTVYVTLPAGVSVPIALNETLQVTVLDRSTDQNPENRGLILRDAAGTLLLAADTAQKGQVLSAPDLAPFAVSRVPEIVGCEHTDCGKSLFEKVRFEVADSSLLLGPGKSQELAAAGQVWRVANVASERYADTWCNLDDLMPWVIANQRVEGQ